MLPQKLQNFFLFELKFLEFLDAINKDSRHALFVFGLEYVSIACCIKAIESVTHVQI